MSFDGLTPRKAIELVGRLRCGKRGVVRQRTDALIEALDMTKWAQVDGARLSGGLKRLTGFAMAAVVPGRLVLLDEPSNDVDPIRRRLLWAQVRAMADEGSTVLVVTHNLEEVESICDRFIVMGQGKIVGDTSPGSIPNASGALQIVLTVRHNAELPDPPSAITNLIASNGQVTGVVGEREALEVIGWAESLRMRGVVSCYEVGSPTLEDVYAQLFDSTEGM